MDYNARLYCWINKDIAPQSLKDLKSNVRQYVVGKIIKIL